jgi:hypothetical protein
MMKIDVKDGGEYFRGLLLLISKDRKVTEAETVLMMRIGKALGFEREFCENAIREILDNKFIVDEPPRFSTSELARMFIRDGLTLARADEETNHGEVLWLKATAEKNGIGADWFHQEHERAIFRQGDSPTRLEVDDPGG